MATLLYGLQISLTQVSLAGLEMVLNFKALKKSMNCFKIRSRPWKIG